MGYKVGKGGGEAIKRGMGRESLYQLGRDGGINRGKRGDWVYKERGWGIKRGRGGGGV